jgi:hypothetical protein
MIGSPLSPPLSAEHILDVALADELGSVLWEVLPEAPGTTVLGCLDQSSKTIILNESRRSLLLDTPGLINTTIAHEIGHWQLHADRSHTGQTMLPGFESLSPPDTQSATDYWDEKNAHRFMGNLLMPHELLCPPALEEGLSNWRGLYVLREQFDVTITALKIRLEELGFTYVDENGKFHGSRAEAAGQQRAL